MGIEVTLDGKSVFKSSFPICKTTEAPRSPDGKQKILAFTFKGGRVFQGEYHTTVAETVDGNIWQAGADADDLILGVSFATKQQILLNTVHIARPDRPSAEQVDTGIVVATFQISPSPPSAPRSFVSPDGAYKAVVLASGKEKGSREAESRVEIRNGKGVVLCSHDFSSADGEHGYGVDTAQWTPDSRFFIFRLRNSGGHMPMYAPAVFWSKSKNHFYQLDDYTADQTFSVASPARITVDTWPDLKVATVSLTDLDKVKTTQLR